MTHHRAVRVFVAVAWLAIGASAAAACHMKSPVRPILAKTAAKTLALPSSVIASHPDPETVRGALDYAILQNEALLVSAPRNVSLLLTACGQYVMNATWFVGPDAEALQATNAAQAQVTKARALRLATRGRDLCWRALEAEEKHAGTELAASPDVTAHRFDRDDVPLLYWSAAAVSAQIAASAGGQTPLARDWPIARALAERALALDATWNRAAIHELLITIESAPDAPAGAEERARKHFGRAIEVQQNLSPGPYVALAMGIVKNKRDRAEFEKLLRQAIAIDPDKDPANRMPTMVIQQRARTLLAQMDSIIR